MKTRNKLFSLAMALILALSLAVPSFAAEGDGIVVLFTNDVHCTSDDGMSYAAVAGYKAEMEAQYGADYVTLVDDGDAIQGGILGSMSQGSWIVDIMNQVGYDLAIPGNHEFDFGMDTFLDIVQNQADYTYLSCNFVDEDGDPVLDAYQIISYGDVDVAYVGISTPETLTKSAPAYFQDESGNYIYGFCQGGDGQELYDQVQETVDAARAEGADYVVALAHLGVDGQSSPWMSTEVIANTTGIDAMLDGHSHTVVPSQTVENADGEDVLLAQTGTKAESIGKLVIAPDGTMTAELVALADVDTTSEAYTTAQTYIQSIQAQYQEMASEVVATSDVLLTINEADGTTRAVRSKETNLGDLCADAYRIMLGADIGWVNGGGVRADIPAGDVTYGDIIEVHPFGNLACVVEVTGQQILDALELGSMYVGEAESGGFLQVSGLKYTINTAIPTSVVLDDAGNFVEVSGERRVSDVQVMDSESGEYAALDTSATYTLASHNYMLKDGGDGYAMFGEDNITILQDEVMVDNEVLISYIRDELGGVVGQEYAQPQGRITIVDGVAAEPVAGFSDVTTANWYADAVAYVVDNELMNGVSADTFEPNSTMSRAMMVTVLYRMAGSPAVSGENAFTDVPDGSWYADAVTWGVENGLVTGTTDTTYEPNAGITREQMATLLWRYAGSPDVSGSDGLDQFTDAASISGYARTAMAWASQQGLVNGTNGTLSPRGSATRAEIATILMRYQTAA